MRKGFLIYEEIRKYLTIYGEAVSHIPILNFILYEEILIFFFISESLTIENRKSSVCFVLRKIRFIEGSAKSLRSKLKVT